jgi:hypothetical protein
MNISTNQSILQPHISTTVLTSPTTPFSAHRFSSTPSRHHPLIISVLSFLERLPAIPNVIIDQYRFPLALRHRIFSDRFSFTILAFYRLGLAQARIPKREFFLSFLSLWDTAYQGRLPLACVRSQFSGVDLFVLLHDDLCFRGTDMGDGAFASASWAELEEEPGLWLYLSRSTVGSVDYCCNSSS